MRVSIRMVKQDAGRPLDDLRSRRLPYVSVKQAEILEEWLGRHHSLRKVVPSLVAVASALILGCPPAEPVSQPTLEDKDFLGAAQAAVASAGAEVVIASGMEALLTAKVDELLYIEEGLKLKIRWKKYRAALKECLQARMEPVEEPELVAVDRGQAAQHLNSETPLHQLQLVRDLGLNAVRQYAECPPLGAEKIPGLRRRAKEELKAWALDKISLVNDYRVLAKMLSPQIEAVGPAVQAAAAVAKKALGDAKAYQIKLDEAKATNANKNRRQIQQLEALVGEAEKLRGEAEQRRQGMADSTKKQQNRVEFGITNFGKRR